jgi:catechol 2,3-dioxygenase-like lactoylglutathione lyase family enzyme
MTDPTLTPGIHHVTRVAIDPQRNLDFWVETLGLRLVKRSINQDDPSTYHFLLADAEGTPACRPSRVAGRATEPSTTSPSRLRSKRTRRRCTRPSGYEG